MQKQITIQDVTNPNCPSEILAEVLRRGKDDEVSRYAALNPNCPAEVLTEVLRRGNNDEVSYYAAKNPNCPVEVLAEVLRRGKSDVVSHCAAQNPNCPAEILTEVLRRGKDDWVSRGAAQNPNCTPKAKIDWMRLTGKIEVEDPKKHIIEYNDKPKPVDPDIAALEKLISHTKHTWYKTAIISQASGKPKYDWNSIDWNKSSFEIAQHLGCTIRMVDIKRKELVRNKRFLRPKNS